MHNLSENYRAMRLREFRVLAPILFFGNVKFAPTLFLYYKSSCCWKLIKTLQVVTHLCASLVLCVMISHNSSCYTHEGETYMPEGAKYVLTLHMSCYN